MEFELENLDEISKIFAEAEASIISKQTKLDFPKQEEEVAIDYSTYNSNTSHMIYYKGIDSIIRNHINPLLPEKKHRRPIRNMKNLLLNYGVPVKSNGRRGSCGKMADNVRKDMVLQIFVEWVQKDGVAPFNLYTMLYDKNIELGYIKRKITEESEQI
jgi:hypothetical protein